MANILLVEDDVALSMGFEYALKKEGFMSKCAKNLKEAMNIYNNYKFDLILLDVMLPDGSGYDFCSDIRKKDNIPVIFITACDEEANVVMGLDIGGDDYITKPVRVKELMSRINAVLRRKGGSVIEKKSSPKIKTGNLIIEPMKFKIYKNGSEVMLTSMEYKLMLLLIQNRGHVLQRDAILEKLWDAEGNFVDGNTLNVYVKRLREKIEDDIRKPMYVETVRGIGYRWSREAYNVE